MTESSLLMFHGPEEDSTQAQLQFAEQLAEMVVKRVGVCEGSALYILCFKNWVKLDSQNFAADRGLTVEEAEFQALCGILRAVLMSNAHSKSAFLLGGLRIQLAASYACEAQQASASASLVCNGRVR